MAASPYRNPSPWPDRRTINGRSWDTRRASDVMQRAYRDGAFYPPHAAELISALQGHRLSQGNADVYGPALINFKDAFVPDTFFYPNVKLDTSAIDDRRGKGTMQRPPLAKEIAPRKKKPRRIPPGQRSQKPPGEATKTIQKRGALAGDGSLERPAPRTTHPKKKKLVKPRFNQGRHDA